MFDIGIFAPFGADRERNIAFCRDTAVRHIALSTGSIASESGDPPSPAALTSLVAEYAAGGVQLAALTPPRIPQAAFSEAAVKEGALGYMRRLVEAMGRAGIPLVHLYLNGLYWGLYNAVERPDSWFTSGNLGGEREDWHAVNHRGTLSGDPTRWDYLRGELKATGNCDAAAAVGKLLAERARAAGIERVAFDRSGFKYHGRVRALADAAREAGLQF